MSVVNDYEPIEHLSVEVMRFRDSILTFKQMEALLECFYRSLNPGNRGLINRLIPGGLERYSYETVAKFLDLVAKPNKDTEKDQQLSILLGQMSNLTQKVEELEVMSKEKSKCIPSTAQGRLASKWSGRRIAEEVGVLDLIRRLAQHNFNSEPVKLGELKRNLATTIKTVVLTPKNTQVLYKAVGYDEELLTHRRNRHQARSQSSPTRVPSAATPSETGSVLAQPSPVTPALPIAPPPQLLNRWKGDWVRTIPEETLLSTEGLQGKYLGVRDTINYHEFEQFTRLRGPYIPS
uniref:Integrase core domain containing protein n=1 Tax=Solanum tuberosum TaxID=4113 RepID=M1DVQ5_SOLTU